MGIWVNDFQSLTRVVYHEPPPEVAARYPFSCIFKEADTQESANPDNVAGVFVDFGEDEKYVVCATDDETLVFSARECPEAEKERMQLKPDKVEVEDVPAQNAIVIPGQATPVAGQIVNEIYGKAWQCTAMTEVPPETMKKINKLLGKML